MVGTKIFSNKLLAAILVLMLSITLILSGCSSEEKKPFIKDPENKEDFFKNKLDRQKLNDNNNNNNNIQEPSEGDLGNFVPKPVPELITDSTEEDAPVYIYLFTHTEDHINHELSEERYLRLAPEVDRINGEYPEVEVAWNIFFQGSDAKTVVERNPETGIVNMLQDYADEGIITFGYHGVHEPVTLQKPERVLSINPSWEEIVSVITDWTSCQRDPVYGGCEVSSGGGIEAVEKIGPVDVVSGVGIELGLLETGAGKHAIEGIVPGRMLGFGFSDHAPGSKNYEEFVFELLEILSPAADTSPTVFWMDDVIRTNDAGLYLSDTLDLKSGDESIKNALSSADRSKSNIFHAGFASKYIYTKDGTSPTNYAYTNPNSPELPEEHVNSDNQIERNYQETISALDYLAGEYMQENNAKFVSSKEIVSMIAADEYWTVSDEQLDVLARWYLLNIGEDGSLPNFVSDGEEFYSLRDLLVLLSSALSEEGKSSIELQLAYGPLESKQNNNAMKVNRKEVVSLAEEIHSKVDFANSASWTVTPDNILDSSYSINSGTLNTAQLLYAMSAVYASDFSGEGLEELTVPALNAMPETITLLEEIGCEICEDTAWSLKPARFR